MKVSVVRCFHWFLLSCWLLSTVQAAFLSLPWSTQSSFCKAITVVHSALPQSENNPFANVTNRNWKESSKIVQKRREQAPQRSYNAAMSDAAFLRKRTDHLLKLNNVESIGPSMKVDLKTFHFLLDAWAFSGELDASSMAWKLLEKMEQLKPLLQPNVRSYTKVMNALSRSGRPDAGELAESLLEKMEQLYMAGDASTKPNTFSYTAVVEAFANSGVQGSAAKAAEYVEVMVQKYKEGDSDVKPTARAFNAAISAYAKSGEQPQAAYQAAALFDQMEELFQEEALEEVKPKGYNYNSLISAWAKCGEEGSAQRAEQVVARMERLYEAGDMDATPTTITFNAVLDVYARCGEEGAAQKAEELLNHMFDLWESGELVEARPNVRSFNAVINAWAKSGHPDAASKAEALLDLMEKLYEEGNEQVRPDVHSFCTVINAWARSQKTGKAERAKNLLNEMKKLHEGGNKRLRPNVVAYNAVMNACAYTNGDVQEQNRAMEIAHIILKDLEQSPYGKPDQVTYGTFLKVCANQMPDCNTRQQIVEVLFKKCCRDGQVGNMVLQQFKGLASEESYQRLVLKGKSIEDDISMEDLPNEWWCNVVEGKWRRRRGHWSS